MPLDTSRLPLRHRPARPSLDAVREQAGGELSHGRSRSPYLKETPRRLPAPTSISASFRTRPASTSSRTISATCSSARETQGERITIEGPCHRRLGYATTRCPGRDLAGQLRGPLQPSGRQPGRQADRRRVPRLGPDRHRLQDRHLYRSRPSSRARSSGRKGAKLMAPHINFWIVARGINIGLNTRMYFSDESGERGGPGAEHDRAGKCGGRR